MAHIPVTQFIGLPVATIANEADPTALEVNAFKTDVTTFIHATSATLTLGFPAHGYVVALPGNVAANASQANRVGRAAELRTYIQGYFNVYTQAHANFVTLIAAAAVALPAPAAPHRRAPKSNLPSEFLGKSPTEAWHFIQQCINYIAIQQFPNVETEIQFILGLCAGNAAKWANEQLIAMSALAPVLPQYLADFDDFVVEFTRRWQDPHEEEKQLDWIMKGGIVQHTSVKKSNDEFNKSLALTTLTGADVAILHAYTTGLKPAIRNTSIAMIYANPNILFHRRQALMVEIDESLMQTRQATNPAPKPRTVINNPVFNVQSTPAAASGSARATTAPRGQTPIKVEAARQYTKLTPQECMELARTRSCFRCWEQGHMATQCP